MQETLLPADIDLMDPDDLVAQLNAEAEWYDANPDLTTTGNLDRAVRYLALLLYTQQVPTALAALPVLLLASDNVREAHPGHPRTLYLWTELRLLAMQYATPDEHSAMPALDIYLEMEPVCAAAGGHLLARLAAARIILAGMWLKWQENADAHKHQPGELQVQRLEDLAGTLDCWVQDTTELLAMHHHQVEGAHVLTTLAGHYLQQNDPNAALRSLDDALNLMDTAPEVTPVAKAGLLLAKASIFLDYQKPQAARPLLQEALELYAEAGEEDYEVEIAQLESLLAETE